MNTGTIPAEVMKWEVSGRLMNLNKQFESVDVDDERTLRGDSVFPGDPYDVVFEFKHPGILGTPLPLRFLVTVEYRGVSIPEKTYRTVLEGERTPSHGFRFAPQATDSVSVLARKRLSGH